MTSTLPAYFTRTVNQRVRLQDGRQGKVIDAQLHRGEDGQVVLCKILLDSGLIDVVDERRLSFLHEDGSQ